MHHRPPRSPGRPRGALAVCLALAAFGLGVPTTADAQGAFLNSLNRFESRAYHIYTNLSREEAVEYGRHMDLSTGRTRVGSASSAEVSATSRTYTCCVPGPTTSGRWASSASTRRRRAACSSGTTP
ncbi:MAG: hypothetical protein AAF710_07445 [Planctomycetota bacterium]